ncbi:MAG TPA: TetR/AcrR family transcriptional regulator C-terminal domain-containing protein, partial [Solirubrobacteraceae bacterium]|nr:TetR/AcrR family transcriptional regulator C-terminal domain-containing protein [Solirubrobacteraceae bacterium]
LAQTSASPGLFRLRERLLGTLLAAGFDEQRALHALGVLTSYALGFGGLRAGAPVDLPERMRELPSAAFPRLRQVADRYDAHLGDDAFTYGLELLLRGLEGDLHAREP